MSPVCLLWDRLSSRGLLGIPKEVWPPQSDMSLTFSGGSGRCGFWRRQGTDVLSPGKYPAFCDTHKVPGNILNVGQVRFEHIEYLGWSLAIGTVFLILQFRQLRHR